MLKKVTLPPAGTGVPPPAPSSYEVEHDYDDHYVNLDEGDLLEVEVYYLMTTQRPGSSNARLQMIVGGTVVEQEQGNVRNSWEKLSFTYIAPASGNVQLRLVSTNDDIVYFDDLKITITTSSQPTMGATDVADYYPFGLRMRGNLNSYRFGYLSLSRSCIGSEYAEDETEETGWNSFELRNYDPVIGRWMTVDPYNQYWSGYIGMGNDPVNGVDPDGGFKTKFGAWFYNLTHGGGGEIQYGLDKDEWFVGRDMENTLANGEITVNYQRVFEASNNNWAGSAFNKFDYGLDYTRDFAAGVNDFVNIYYEMREANWVNSDKYFHSKANFKATVRGDGGEYAAEKMSNLREIIDQRIKKDPREASLADQEANMYGRERAKHYKVHQMPNMNYKEAIPKYRPANLPSKY